MGGFPEGARPGAPGGGPPVTWVTSGGKRGRAGTGGGSPRRPRGGGSCREALSSGLDGKGGWREGSGTGTAAGPSSTDNRSRWEGAAYERPGAALRKLCHVERTRGRTWR
ncbi:hypothetical protein GCM10010363_32810 [Streptomyces omiyaensis]|nr:hypothetical protein GCM10010363_32810 [Streptomyces omiyaensis]